MKRPILSVILLCWLTGVASAQRLPQTVVPEHYRISFTPTFEKDTFSADETIAIRVLEGGTSVTLNSIEIEFQDATITSGTTTQKAQVTTTDPRRETATLTVASPLEPGPAEVHIRFRGTLNEKLRGFYLGKANKRKYAFTQFEPTDARRAFPCFDEPALKATFAISLVVDKGDTAISNGKIISDTPVPGENKHTLQFSTTPKMSSYLVAMAVGDFQCLEGGVDGIPVRICATPDKKDLGRFALESAEQILRFYNRYYGTKYPFGKLDVLAAPDFEAGAMENTAAIFSRETLLLIDDRTASVDSHRTVAGVLAHEMAHMWFGDLVTMKWWDDVWLNEGFASWMAHKPVEAWKPEWNTRMDEAQGTDGALNVDSLPSTRPIRARAETSGQINEMFDGIAYGKASAVLRMIESYVGEEVFRQGVNAYLQEHAYGNATAEDLWNAITKTSGKPVNEIMRTFVDQPGAPLVSVETECDGDTTFLTLEQRRYSLDRALFEAGTKEVWQIPVCTVSAAPGSANPPPTQCVLLAQRRETFRFKGCAPWVFANAGARGYYRSEYSPEVTRQMARSGFLSPQDRIMLLGDEWALVRVGKHKIGDYLALAESFRDDRTRAVAEALVGRLIYVGDYLVNDSDREPYRAWVRSLLTQAAHELGWKPAPGESDERRSLRATVLGVLGYTGRDAEMIAQARLLVEHYMQEPSSVDPTLVDTIVSLAAVNGDRALYDQFLGRVKTAKSPEEYYRYTYALTSFSDPALLERTLNYALSPEVRNQDVTGLIGSVLGNPAGRDLAWTFLKTHWAELQNKLSTWGGSGIVGSTSSFCDARSRDDVRQFFTQHKVEAAERALQQAIEHVNYCIDLRSQQESNLASWLKQRSTSPGR